MRHEEVLVYLIGMRGTDILLEEYYFQSSYWAIEPVLANACLLDAVRVWINFPTPKMYRAEAMTDSQSDR